MPQDVDARKTPGLDPGAGMTEGGGRQAGRKEAQPPFLSEQVHEAERAGGVREPVALVVGPAQVGAGAHRRGQAPLNGCRRTRR